jgi:hypothetical protein
VIVDTVILELFLAEEKRIAIDARIRFEVSLVGSLVLLQIVLLQML